MKIRPVGTELSHAEGKITFRDFAEAPKKHSYVWITELWLIWRVQLCRITLRISFELKFGPCFVESNVFKHLVVKRSLCP